GTRDAMVNSVSISSGLRPGPASSTGLTDRRVRRRLKASGIWRPCMSTVASAYHGPPRLERGSATRAAGNCPGCGRKAEGMGREVGNGARLRIIAAAGLLMLTPLAASAQTRSIQPGMQQFAPAGGPGAIAPGQTLVPPSAAMPAGPPLAVPNAAIPAGQVGLVVSARYGRDF